MNPMLSALKSRRSGSEEQKPSGAQEPKGVLDLVRSLSPGELEQLKALLTGDGAVSAEAISKGAPSSEEKAKIQERMGKENEQAELEESDAPGEEIDSDEIALGMLDSRFKNAAPSAPRNLHERVQMNMAKNLKEKGKI